MIATMIVRLLTVISLSATTAAAATELYISPDGDDANSGTIDKPFRTIEHARAEARRAKASRSVKAPVTGVTVWLRGGRYELANPFDLTSDDSGQDASPMVYRAYPNEMPVVSGGRVVRGWKKLDGDLPGLPASAKGKVWATEVPEAKDGKWAFRQLWANGNRLTRARWPNESPSGNSTEEEASFEVTDAANPPADPDAIKVWREHAWRTARFSPESLQAFPDRKLPADLATGPAEMVARNKGRWAMLRIPIERAEGTQLHMAVPLGVLAFYWGGMHLMTPQFGACHIENALSLLDSPHEWFLDRNAGRLYYLPADEEDPNTEEFIAPRIEQLIRIRGSSTSPVKFVELRGIGLEHAEWTIPQSGYRPALGCFYGTELTPLSAPGGPAAPQLGHVPCPAGSIRSHDEYPEFSLPAAVDLAYAENCLIESCRVIHVGASGIGLGEGCRQDRVIGCEVYDAGGHGIHLGMPHGPVCGEDFAWKTPEDQPSDNLVANCHVHDSGKMDWGAYGIFSSYCARSRIAHNLVERQPYCGICPCFTWYAFPSGRDEEVTVEYNEIHHVMLRLFDGGAIYSKDGVAHSSFLRGNLIHDIGGATTMNNGIFLDDGSYGFHIEANDIYNVTQAIRFNNSSKEKFTWGKNYLDEKERSPDLPGKAGPEEPYRTALLGTKSIHP